MDAPAKQLLQLEEALLDPATRQDRRRVGQLLAEDFVEFGASGRGWTRDQVLERLVNEPYLPVRIEDFQCALLAIDVALLTYRAVRTDASSGSEASSLRSSIWTKKTGEWRMRFHQGTRAA